MFEHNDIKLINADFFEEYKNNSNLLKDSSFDLILTDVPYGIADKGKVTKSHGKIYSNKEAWGDTFKDSFTRSEYDKFIGNFLLTSYQLLKPGHALITFIDRKYAGCLIDIAENIGFVYKQIITFVKVNCVPKIRCYNYASATEIAVWLHKKADKGTKTKPAVFNYQKPTKGKRHPDGALDVISYHNNYSSNVYFYNIGSKITNHPTEKYIKMWEPLLNHHSNNGDLILDPFAGQFSLAHLCEKTGRKYIGYEIIKNHYDKGLEIFKTEFKIEKGQSVPV